MQAVKPITRCDAAGINRHKRRRRNFKLCLGVFTWLRLGVGLGLGLGVGVSVSIGIGIGIGISSGISIGVGVVEVGGVALPRLAADRLLPRGVGVGDLGPKPILVLPFLAVDLPRRYASGIEDRFHQLVALGLRDALVAHVASDLTSPFVAAAGGVRLVLHALDRRTIDLLAVAELTRRGGVAFQQLGAACDVVVTINRTDRIGLLSSPAAPLLGVVVRSLRVLRLDLDPVCGEGVGEILGAVSGSGHHTNSFKIRHRNGSALR